MSGPSPKGLRGLAVVGTDTGVGKTAISTALVAAWRARGLHPAGMKPCETGVGPEGPLDALALQEAAGGGDALEHVCPFRFAMPAAPLIAARAEGRRVEPELLLETASLLSNGGRRPLVVEGAGGLLVPLTDTLDFSGLLQALGLPVVLVGRAGLGTLNHTLLTLEALRTRAIAVEAVVLVESRPDPRDPTVSTNLLELGRRAGVPVLGPMPFVADLGNRRDQLSRRLGEEMDRGTLLPRVPAVDATR